ncbi:hypothetical protein [Desulfovibrio ferrophilus]|uniref:Uncharacterized protein n=1 Tax=Desulfovibrio ferrophilus TaxID=241368 RepID=A0A2Z6AZG3_9BACT|nr:hypothetical protein [Desulfovibrio ferrophilus]BBD08657.1 uncharacterized protein DFE_1931 [Desulfovibrio ferrophilus]
MGREEILERFNKYLEYNSDEAAMVAADEPRARFIEALAEASGQYLIVVEVLESANCNSGYNVGDQFVLDVAGNFIAKRCPQRMCVYLISQLALPLGLMNERFCAGLDPNGIHFMRRVNCLDAGVACKGYGAVQVGISAVPRREFLKAAKAVR